MTNLPSYSGQSHADLLFHAAEGSNAKFAIVAGDDIFVFVQRGLIRQNSSVN